MGSIASRIAKRSKKIFILLRFLAAGLMWSTLPPTRFYLKKSSLLTVDFSPFFRLEQNLKCTISQFETRLSRDYRMPFLFLRQAKKVELLSLHGLRSNSERKYMLFREIFFEKQVLVPIASSIKAKRSVPFLQAIFSRDFIQNSEKKSPQKSQKIEMKNILKVKSQKKFFMRLTINTIPLICSSTKRGFPSKCLLWNSLCSKFLATFARVVSANTKLFFN